jgi:hypothetical protein
MHYEVDMVIQLPFYDNAKRFLTSVQSSANQVLRFRGDDTITITVEAQAMDLEGAVKAAHGEIGRIYPGTIHKAVGEPRVMT